MTNENTVSGSVNVDMLLKFKTSHDIDTSAFRTLREIANTCDDAQAFIIKCSEAENEYMEMFYKEEPNAKKKNGKWKYSSYLPSRYVSAKSVLKNSLYYGISIGDNAKTTLEKKIKGKKAEEKPTLTPEERAATFVDKMNKEYYKLDKDVQDQVHFDVKVMLPF